jgi:hypothetical protein
MATVVTREQAAPAKAPKKPMLEKSNAKVLFESYQGCQDAVDRARQALEAAMLARSAAVQAIKDALGTGPFQWRDQTVSVSTRSTKAPDGSVASTNYYFKSIGGAVQTIE